MTLEEMRNKRNALRTRILEMRDQIVKALKDGGEEPPELRTNFDKVSADYDKTTKQLEILVAGEKLERDASITTEDVLRREHEERNRDGGGNDVVTQENRDQAVATWARNQAGLALNDDEVKNAQRCNLNLNSRHIDFKRKSNYREVRRDVARHESRAAVDTGLGTGGETIPEGFVPQWEISQLAFGDVHGVADVIRTSSGNDLPWPHSNDTGNIGALLAESGTATEQGVATAAMVLNAYKFTSKLVKVSAELLEDTAFNIVSELGRMLGERIARALNVEYTTGSGTARPRGVVVASALGKLGAVAGAGSTTSDEIMDLFHSLDPAYRKNARFMLHDSILAAVRKLKDTTNQYLWQPGMQTGSPDMLFGKPVTINQQMASTFAINQKIILFGDFKKYKVRDVTNIRLKRLVELYAGQDQEGFVAFSRHDADLLDAGTNPIVHLALAAA